MSVRKSWRLSAAAVASAALAAMTLGPQAHATVGGVPASSPLTVSHADGSLETVGGGSTAVPWGGTDVSWSPDGSKYAFSANNQIYTANADGSGLKVVARGAASGAHPVWAFEGELLIFAGWDPATGNSGQTQLMATWSNGSATADGTPQSWALPKTSAAGAVDSSPDYGGDTLAFARSQNGAATGIWVRSPAGNYTPFQVAAAGSAPTVSPDGKTVAFVQADKNKVPQIWTVPASVPAGGLATPVQQTFAAAGSATAPAVTVASPAFSPDGKSIAFDETSVPAGASKGASVVRSIALNTDPKATANTETTIAVSGALTGTEHLAYRSEFAKQVVRLAGKDRLWTAYAVSQDQWRNNGNAGDAYRSQADVAVLSRDDLPADALAGSALAVRKNGPLLLTGSTTLSPQAAAELKRILRPGATVYLLGGDQALSPAIASAVHKLGFNPDRLAGADRYSTAVQIADQVEARPSQILVATGNDFADALSAGAAAGATPGAVVVLTDDTRMPAPTAAYLHRFGTDFGPGSSQLLAAVGGQALKAIDSAKQGYWRVPLVGKDRIRPRIGGEHVLPVHERRRCRHRHGVAGRAVRRGRDGFHGWSAAAGQPGDRAVLAGRRAARRQPGRAVRRLRLRRAGGRAGRRRQAGGAEHRRPDGSGRRQREPDRRQRGRGRWHRRAGVHGAGSGGSAVGAAGRRGPGPGVSAVASVTFRGAPYRC